MRDERGSCARSSYVQTCAFSPHSGFMAAGNDKGKVLLYRLNHYEEA